MNREYLFIIALIMLVITIIVFSRLFNNYQIDPKENSRTLLGFERMKKTDLIVASLLRDASKSFECSKNLISELSRNFRSVKVIILENDSLDDTRDKWLELSSHYKYERDISSVTGRGSNVEIILIGCGINAEKCTYNDMKTEGHLATPSRIQKMVRLRNEMMDYIYKSINNDDYVFLTDLDILGKLDMNGVANTFGYFEENKKIQAIGCRGTQYSGSYFDPYAYSDATEYTKRDSWINKHFKVISIPLMRGLLRVRSSFSGGIFIKGSILLKEKPYCKYEEIDGKAICEHESFFNNLNVYINTNMIYEVFSH